MSYEDNVRAILESNFTGFKDEIIDAVVDKICSLEAEPCECATNNGLKLERHSVTTSSEQKELINALFKYDNELIDKVFDVGEREIYFESDLIFDGIQLQWNLKRSKVDDIIKKIEQARDKDQIAEYPYNRCIKIIREVLDEGCDSISN